MMSRRMSAPPPQPPHSRALASRLLYAGLAAGAAAVLGVARLLTPSSDGMGTHQQLGLPPCTFHTLTGHGCPGCGMTTSFAALARGQLGQAFEANPLGILLFAATALSIPLLLYRAARPVPIAHHLESKWAALALLLFTVTMFATWLVRLALGLA